MHNRVNAVAADAINTVVLAQVGDTMAHDVSHCAPSGLVLGNRIARVAVCEHRCAVKTAVPSSPYTQSSQSVQCHSGRKYKIHLMVQMM